MKKNITFGAWLKQRRRHLDLTQKELADLAGCGLGTLRKIEGGTRRPSKDLAIYIGEALDIPADKLPAFVSFARRDPYMVDVPLPTFARDLVTPPQPNIPKPLTAGEVQAIRHNLPPQPTPFIGRDTEIAILHDFLANPDSRLITIHGPGGMGKTRLALACAEQLLSSSRIAMFRDGLIFVDLAPLSDPSHIVSAIAKEIQFQLRYGNEDARSVKEQLLDYLHSKELLLVLDNFEQLLPDQNDSRISSDMAGSVDLITDILQNAPQVQIIVTSRERLRLRSEQIFPIQGLDFPYMETAEDAAKYSAVQLFLQIARRNQPGFKPQDPTDLTNLSHICHLVAGMPLALELAAAWVDMLSLGEIVAELLARDGQGLDLFEANYHDMPIRHQSIRATFDYSWQKLNKQEQKAFAQLSVFRGGFTLQAAQRVAGASVPLLARLVKRSLLQFNRQHGRYKIHELLRQYGAIRLQETPAQTDKINELHSIYYTDFLQKIEPQLMGSDQNDALRVIDDEIDNVRKSWRWAADNKHVELIAKSADCIGSYYEIRGWLREGDEVFADAEEILEEVAGQVATIESDFFMEQLSLALGSVLTWRGVFIYHLPSFETNGPLPNQGEHYRAATQRLKKALVISEEVGDYQRSVNALNRLGRMTEQQGDYNIANDYLEKSLILARQRNDKPGIGSALWGLGWLKYRLGQHIDARNSFSEYLASSRSLDDQRGHGQALIGLGFVAYMSEDYEEAQVLLMKSRALLREIGDQFDMVVALNMLGELGRLSQDYLKAKSWYQEGLQIAKEIGHQYYVGIILANLGHVARAVGDDAAAYSYYYESLKIAQSRDATPIILDILAGLAGILVNRGRALEALEILTMVLHHSAVVEETRQIANSIVASLQKRLSPEVFSTARARGRVLDLDLTVTKLIADSD